MFLSSFGLKLTYTRDSDKTIVLGGEQGSAFKSDESLRIQQQALLKKCQYIVHVLAACSRAHKQLEYVLFSAGPGGTMPIEHATQLGFIYATKDVYLIDEVELIDIPGTNVLSIQQLGDIRLSRSSLEESLFAASDSFHIFAAEMSEIERQRDELYVRARSGNPDFKIPRPTSDPTKFVKPMDKLDKLADARSSALRKDAVKDLEPELNRLITGNQQAVEQREKVRPSRAYCSALALLLTLARRTWRTSSRPS